MLGANRHTTLLLVFFFLLIFRIEYNSQTTHCRRRLFLLISTHIWISIQYNIVKLHTAGRGETFDHPHIPVDFFLNSNNPKITHIPIKGIYWRVD